MSKLKLLLFIIFMLIYDVACADIHAFKFRENASCGSDQANETYWIADDYDTTRNGETFGRVSGTRDLAESCAFAQQALTGYYFVSYADGTVTLRIDVTPGNYNLRLALGEHGGTHYDYLQILDNATVRATIDKTGTGAAPNNYWDANGNLLSAAVWDSSNGGASDYITVSISSGIITLKLKGGTPANGAISYFSYELNETTTTAATTTTTAAATTTTASTTTTTAPAVNLQMDSIAAVTGTWQLGTGKPVSNTVINAGSASAGQFYVYFYVSTNTTCTAGPPDIVIGVRSITSLANGATNSDSTTITMPVTVPPGSYYLCAYANPQGAALQAESSYSDNTIYTGPFTVSALAAFDHAWDFRATAVGPLPGVTDPSDTTYFIGEPYPTNRNSSNFGMISSTPYYSASFFDVNASLDTRLAGSMSRENGFQSRADFDLGGPGDYTVYLAMGSVSTTNHMCLQIFDGANQVMSIDQTISGGKVIDANGNPYDFSGSNGWPTLQAGVSLTFSGNLATVILGCTTDDNSFSILKYIRFVRTVAGVTTTTTTSTTTSTTTTSTSTTTLPAKGYCPSSTLSWSAPTTFTDGSAISGLVGYKIYIGNTPGFSFGNALNVYDTHSTGTSTVANNSTQSGVMGTLGNSTNQPNGLYYANISAYVSATQESALDGEIVFNYSTVCSGPTLPTTTTTTSTIAATTSTVTTTSTSTTVTTLLTGPNLHNFVAPQLTGGQASLTACLSYSLTYTIENNGDTTTGAGSFGGVYLSTDQFITIADTLLITFNIGTLAVGANTDVSSIPRQVTFIVPCGTATGNYYIGIYVDSTRAIAESNENDNGLAMVNAVDIVTQTSTTIPGNPCPARISIRDSTRPGAIHDFPAASPATADVPNDSFVQQLIAYINDLFPVYTGVARIC